jgi:hypothetical protein
MHGRGSIILAKMRYFSFHISSKFFKNISVIMKFILYMMHMFWFIFMIE